MSKRIISVVLALCMMVSCAVVGTFAAGAAVVDSQEVSAQADSAQVSASTDPQSSIQGSAVLHCFNWSYNTIKENLQDIKDAGYTAVQTSPVQPPKDYSSSWTDQSGQWWKLYQPISIRIAESGESWLGSKAELKSLCEEADKYGIKVVCDIVANHMGNISGTGNSMDDISTQVDSDLRSNSSYWHINSIWASDSSRYDMTQGSIGEPDLNTGNSEIQNRYKQLLIDCIDCGVDGFRFDAAKHIELPTDSGCSSDFWPVVINGSQASTSNEIYYYGEILNTAGTDISNYTKYMSVTDNNTSDAFLVAANNGNASGLASSSYNKGAGDSKSVLWVESHDTYMGDSGTGGLSNTSGVSSDVVIKAWGMVGSRANSAALFFARPAAKMGSASTDTSWKSDAVREVNKFKNYFDGESEYLSSSGSIAYNERGTSGVVLVNCSGTSTSVKVEAKKMASGTYTDAITGNVFTVSNGYIEGEIGSTGVAVVYNDLSVPSASVTPGSKSFKTDTLDLTLRYSNATAGYYSLDGILYNEYTNGQQITIGSDVDYENTIKVYVKATDGTTTSEVKEYEYFKTNQIQTVYFDNSSYNWSQVYAYIYVNSSTRNASWPGVAMTKGENNIYFLEVPEELANGYAIFTESSDATTNRYPADGETGMALGGKSMIMGANHSWTEYVAAQPTSESTEPTSESTEPSSETTEPSSETTEPTSESTEPTSESTEPSSDVTEPSSETTEPSTSPVNKILIGDVDGDGEVTIKDATRIQMHIAELETLTGDSLAAADTNQDGYVNIKDAASIQYYIVDRASSGNCCGKYIGEDETEPVSSEATTEPVSSEATTEPTTAPTTEPTTAPATETNYVYFQNNDMWSAPYAYYWSDSNTKMTTWPGKAMENIGSGVYRVEVSEGATRIIFSDNGSNQTENLTIPGAGYIYNNGSWSKYADADKYYTLYLKNNSGWSTPYAYYWSSSDTSMSIWPGVPMINVGSGVYKITVPNSATKIIFSNNGSSKTGDLSIPGDNYIYNNGWSKYN